MRLDRMITLRFARRTTARNNGTLPIEDARTRQMPRRLPILMYHSISHSQEDGVSAYYRTSTSPERFLEQMSFLRAEGWRGVSVQEGIKELSKKPDSFADPRVFVITFDDGFRDFMASALDVLEEHGFGATVYLATAYCSKTGTPKQFLGRDCLTWNDVRIIRQTGVSFGSHTVTHPKLVSADWSRVQSEIIDSKTMIEESLQEPVHDFAYPFSFPQAHRIFCHRFKILLKAIGYSTCVTTNIGTAQPIDDFLALPRLPINQEDDPLLLRAKMDGAYDWLSIPQIITKYAKRALLIQ